MVDALRPEWGPDGWDVPELALPEDAADRLPAGVGIELHHCLDDEVVAIEHLYLLAARLPDAVPPPRRPPVPRARDRRDRPSCARPPLPSSCPR